MADVHDQVEAVATLTGEPSHDIVAKAEGDIPPVPPGQLGPMQMMMRSLLADRFKLVAFVLSHSVPADPVAAHAFRSPSRTILVIKRFTRFAAAAPEHLCDP